MTTMHNPPHPGETLREDVLPALGLTVTEAAAQLGVTRAALSRVLNGRAAISPEMALRLEGWLGVENGGSADAWIAQQAAYDLWKARMAGMPKLVLERANQILAHLESLHKQQDTTGKQKKMSLPAQDYQLSFFQLDDPVLSNIKEELLKTDINTLTPVEALMKLNEIRKMVGG